jgi:hypothetical protein
MVGETCSMRGDMIHDYNMLEKLKDEVNFEM